MIMIIYQTHREVHYPNDTEEFTTTFHTEFTTSFLPSHDTEFTTSFLPSYVTKVVCCIHGKLRLMIPASESSSRTSSESSTTAASDSFRNADIDVLRAPSQLRSCLLMGCRVVSSIAFFFMRR